MLHAVAEHHITWNAKMEQALFVTNPAAHTAHPSHRNRSLPSKTLKLTNILQESVLCFRHRWGIATHIRRSLR